MKHPEKMPMREGKEMGMDTHMEVGHTMSKKGADCLHEVMPIGPAEPSAKGKAVNVHEGMHKD